MAIDTADDLSKTLQTMAENASKLRAAGQALREAASQPEATTVPRSVTIERTNLSPIGQVKR